MAEHMKATLAGPANYKPYPDDDKFEMRRLTMPGEKGEEVELHPSEFERLAGLGFIEGEDADPKLKDRGLTRPGARLAEGVVLMPNQKVNTVPSDPSPIGTPKDPEIATDPRMDADVDTSQFSMGDLKAKDGSLHKEAARLGISVDDKHADQIKDEVRAARESEADKLATPHL